MQLRVSQVFGIGVLLAHLFVMPSIGMAAQVAEEKASPAAGQTPPSVSWNLEDLIFKAAELSRHYSELNQIVTPGTDISAVLQRLSEISTELEETAVELARLKVSEENVHLLLVHLNRTLQLHRWQLEKAANPATDALRRLVVQHDRWNR